uniref:Uncharacterized protein n=1 Tax=Tanacetum cinerariifolium TaxID=118510 RepID=A0A6L2MUL8_TANCI|nr:hypothetical protein [Tanacetum cinerariifolium]
MCKAYETEPSVDLLCVFLNMDYAGNLLTLSNRSGLGVPKEITKLITYLEEGRKIFEGYWEKETNCRVFGMGDSPKGSKVPPQESKASGDPFDPLDMDSDPDIHGFRRLSLGGCSHDSSFVETTSQRDNMTRKLMSTLTKARASCDVINEKEREKHKAYVELEMRCNDALQDLDKNPLVLDMRKEINTLQGQTLVILHLKVKGLESERERLKKSKTHLLQEINGLRQDRAAVVAKVVPHMATKLVCSDEMGLLVARLAKAALFHGRCLAFEEVAALKEPFELEKMHGYRPLSKKEFHQAGDNLAATSCPFLAEVIVDPYAPLEVLLSKKPNSLHSRPSPSSSEPSSLKDPNPTS